MRNVIKIFSLVLLLSIFNSCQSFWDKAREEYEAEELALSMSKSPVDISKGKITSNLTGNALMGALKVYYYNGIAYSENQLANYLDTFSLDPTTRNNLERYKRKHGGLVLGTILSSTGCGAYLGGLYSNNYARVYTGENFYGDDYFIGAGIAEVVGLALVIANYNSHFDAVVISFNDYIEEQQNLF